MTRLEAALLEVVSHLEQHQVPYMVVGGFANLHWGTERLTRDLDLAIEIEDRSLQSFVESLSPRLRPVVPDVLDFARRNHLIRVQTQGGVDVDLLIAALPYEAEAVRRAVSIAIGDRIVRLCTAEDLIIYKLASERPQDALDVQGIVERHGSRLDREYLRPRVRDLGIGLERPDLAPAFERLLAGQSSDEGQGNG